MSEEYTYKKAGVDIDEGERFVKLISPIVKRTFRPEVLTGIGSFGALFGLDTSKYKEPVLVSGTDGVGTKLKVAFMTGVHDTIGIDLVAMCVNDILTCGAEPLFFLDYFATSKLTADDSVKVVEGIARGCELAGASLVGGETAEMPGFYSDGEYDLSGFAVGVVNKSDIIDGSTARDGDVLIGVSSSGIHSNGYSLVRKVFFEKEKMKPDSYIEEFGRTLGEELLSPTRIYVKPVLEMLKKGIKIKAMAHVTGGGITDNLPRVLPEGIGAVVNRNSWTVPPVFQVMQRLGNIPDEDMRRTFNMGIGFILVADSSEVNNILEFFGKYSYDCNTIGILSKGNEGVRYESV
jgi:phosphoribosylformylglycinamidine cyclo-ligase